MVHDPRNHTNDHEIGPGMPLFVLFRAGCWCDFVDRMVSSAVSMLIEL
jgi:hypothetical protein